MECSSQCELSRFPANDKKQSRAKRQQKTTRVNIITTKLLLSAEPNQPVRIKSGFTKPYTLSHSEYYFLLKQRSESLLLTLTCLPHHYGFAEFICSNHLMFDSAEDSVLHLRHHQLQLLLFVTELMLTPSEWCRKITDYSARRDRSLSYRSIDLNDNKDSKKKKKKTTKKRRLREILFINRSICFESIVTR